MALISRLTNLFSGSLKPTQKIREIFFNLIQNNQGSITEIDLAMAANISGTDAKKYLEQFAVEFDATFEVTEKGHVVYLFPIRNLSDRKNNLKTSQNSLSQPQKEIPTIDKTKTENISQNTNQNYLENNQPRKNYVSSSTSKHKTKLDNELTNIQQNLKNTENEIKENLENIDNDIKDKLKNVESDLKNVGDSLNNIFK